MSANPLKTRFGKSPAPRRGSVETEIFPHQSFADGEFSQNGCNEQAFQPLPSIKNPVSPQVTGKMVSQQNPGLLFANETSPSSNVFKTLFTESRNDSNLLLANPSSQIFKGDQIQDNSSPKNQQNLHHTFAGSSR